MKANTPTVLLAVFFGIAIGLLVSQRSADLVPTAHAQEAAKPPADVATLQAEIQALEPT